MSDTNQQIKSNSDLNSANSSDLEYSKKLRSNQLNNHFYHNHASRILKSKKSAIDMFSNRYYNSNVVGDHLNFLPLKNNNYELNESKPTASTTASNTSGLGIADLINTYNLLDKKKQIKMKRPKSAFFQPRSVVNQTKSPPKEEPQRGTVKSATLTQVTSVETGSIASNSETSGSAYSSLSSNPYSKLKHVSRRPITENSFKSKDDSIIRMSDFLNSLELNSNNQQPYLTKTASSNASSSAASNLNSNLNSNTNYNTIDSSFIDMNRTLRTVKHISGSMKNKISKNYRYYILL